MGDTVKVALLVLEFLQLQLGAGCIRIFEDNQDATQSANNPRSSARSRHIDVQHHVLRELVYRG